DLYDTQLRVTRLFAITIPTMTLILNVSTVAVLWFGAMRVQDGALPIGNLTAFLQYLIQILFAVLTAVFMFILIPRAAVSSGRIREVLDTEPTIHDPADPVQLDPSSPARGSIEFRGVDVRDLAREDLWAEIGMIPQKAFLFGGSVRTNLRFGKADATDDDLWLALDIAQG